MDSSLDICKGPAIVWKTEKAEIGERKRSSVFSLLGATWQLEMQAFKFFQTDRYRLILCRTGNTKPQSQFSIITTVQSTEAVKDDFYFQSVGHKKNVIDDITPLWSRSKSKASEEITDFEDGAYVTVICVFTAVDGTLNETVEVTTQTDIDRSFPVKNPLGEKLSSDANLDSLSEDLCKLLEEKVNPDINLRCGGRTVKAHKAILTARSRVFSAMLQSKMLESETGVVDITDVDADVLEVFLKYVYSGRLSDLSDEGLPSLYATADKYDVRALKSECSERMINNLSRENCLNILLLANVHSDQDFMNVILDFILNQTEILKSQEWTKFRKENPILSNEVYDFVAQRKWL